jgi:hypothetical protein
MTCQKCNFETKSVQVDKVRYRLNLVSSVREQLCFWH